MPKSNGPKWDPGQDRTAGIKALELAREFQSQIEPRLPPGLLGGLEEDVKSLEAAGDEGKAKVTEIKGFTDSKRGACEKASHWASAIREALKREGVSSEVKKAAGVGSRFQVSEVDSVIASVNAVLAAYDKFPEPFRAAGVLPDDMEEGKRWLATLSASDMTQETAKAKKLSSTSARHDLRKRIEYAVGRIRGAGILHFRGEPATAARFAALLPNGGNGGRSAAPEPPPPAGPSAAPPAGPAAGSES